MRAIPLKKCFEKQEFEALGQDLYALGRDARAIGLADANGDWLVVYPDPSVDRTLVKQACHIRQKAADGRGAALPLVVDGTLYGVLYGEPVGALPLGVLQRWLVLLIQKALTHKALASETLDRYREINLLYRVHETISASLDLDEVVRRVLLESTRIIKASGGAVLLVDPADGELATHDHVGVDVVQAERSLLNQALSAKVLRTGKSRILNNLQQLVRPGDPHETELASMLGAPLKCIDQVLGVIVLARVKGGAMFTASDQKLLSALASQAGVAIANAREVQVRERRLRQQIEALRIEIDEAKKQREVFAITESEYFAYLQANARKMRAEFEL